MSTVSDPDTDHMIIYLPAGSPDWGGALVQFTSAILSRDGRQYAAWAGERLARAVQSSDGTVALTHGGTLLGLMLVEITDDAAEMSFPWTTTPNRPLARELTEALRQLLREDNPTLRYFRVERQVVPGEIDPSGVEEAGFACHWRLRMGVPLTLPFEKPSLPSGYRLESWNIAMLDEAAAVMFAANQGTLDAALYAPFFGDSPAQCRKGLLTILVGKFGPVIPEATLCAFHGDDLVGINLVIDEGDRMASFVEISVTPAHQRQGIGRQLMLGSLRVLCEQNYDRAELAVTRANTTALALYESLGFTELGQFPVCIPAEG